MIIGLQDAITPSTMAAATSAVTSLFLRGNTLSSIPVGSHVPFPSGMGTIYLVAFSSLFVQYPGLFGSEGLQPVGTYLKNAARGGNDPWIAFTAQPTLLWFSGTLGSTKNAHLRS